MNVWITRVLRTAVFTGGLLAVGTGIASADDDVLDVTAPVTVTDNAVAVLGTAPGSTPPEIVLPAVSGTVAVDLGPVAVSAPVTVGGNAADVAGIDLAQPAAPAAPAAPAGPGGGGAGAVDVDVPVVVCGNAVAALGGAEAGCTPPDGGTGAGGTGGTGGTGADGTVLGADVPVLACGNGVGVLGRAAADCGAPDGAPGEPGTSGGQPALGAGGAGGAEGTQHAVAVAAADDVPGWTADHGQADGMPAGGAQAGVLAWTGFPVTLPLLGGLLAVALGAGLRLLGRHRRTALG